jgi:predicted DNA-binding transcriptional regulator YafY
MNRLDRALGILLLLSDQKSVTATALAARFEVSVRTIYRDVDMLGTLGVPVYAERGSAGGYRLLEGFFLAPIAFTRNEAVSLLLALALLRSLHLTPLAQELETAERKLQGVLPKHLRPLLAETQRLFGFERTARDAFHGDPEAEPMSAPNEAMEQRAIDTFLKAVLDGVRVTIAYRVAAGTERPPRDVDPLGVLWDRDRWYLVGRRPERARAQMWRADRVRDIAATTIKVAPDPAFDVRRFLGRTWLAAAMKEWAKDDPVKIRMTGAQARRMRTDWLYGHAHFERGPDGSTIMTFGEGPETALAVLRWLGPGAELIAPAAWRARAAEELSAMAAAHR